MTSSRGQCEVIDPTFVGWGAAQFPVTGTLTLLC